MYKMQEGGFEWETYNVKCTQRAGPNQCEDGEPPESEIGGDDCAGLFSGAIICTVL